jgi:pyrroline-5-carboxylate reductase
MEAMIDAAVQLGFSRIVAQQLVEQTLKGSVAYAVQSDKSVSELRYQVTSPGGTTAAALYELEKGGLRTVVADGITAAYKRGIELGRPHESE